RVGVGDRGRGGERGASLPARRNRRRAGGVAPRVVAPGGTGAVRAILARAVRRRGRRVLRYGGCGGGGRPAPRSGAPGRGGPARRAPLRARGRGRAPGGC